MSLRADVAASEGTAFPGRSFADLVLAPNYAQAGAKLLQPVLAVQRAHLVMLVEQGVLPRAQGAVLLRALAGLDLDALAHSTYDPRFEDLFFRMEELLSQAAGDVASNLRLARSRNDTGVALYRLVLRARLLELMAAAAGLYEAYLFLAGEHVGTVMLAYTHTQPAQPTTLGHWLLAAADVLDRDLGRLRAAYETVNLSPMGAAALGTSGIPIDRERVAGLLGFQGLVENSYDAIAGADYLTGAAAATLSAALHVGRVVQDLLLWCTEEFGALRVADPYVQISSIMPQKRNPVALEHGRALLSRAGGAALTVLHMVHNTPLGDINDTEDDLQPQLWQALDLETGVFRLLAAVLATVEVNRERLLERARASYANLTELADTLARRHGLTFGQAHGLASALAREAHARGIADVRQISPDLLDEVAGRVLGRQLGLGEAELRQALDPEHFVAVRRVRGGPAPEEVGRMLAGRRETLAGWRRWLQQTQAGLAQAGQRLDAACREMMG